MSALRAMIVALVAALLAPSLACATPDAVQETKASDGKSKTKDTADAKDAKDAKGRRPPPPKLVIVGGKVEAGDHALRYYAALHQSNRVNAELSRLRRLYPGYEPPADLYEPVVTSGVDEQPFWDLYAADRLDELNAAITLKQREKPGWKPSTDLARKIRRKELRLKIGGFWKAERFLDLIDYIKGEHVDVRELAEEVDVVWNIAEAYARARQTAESIDAFKSVLTTSKDPHIRITTLQKAIGCLRISDVETLMAALPAEAQGDRAAIAIALTRARMAGFLHGERAEPLPQEELAAFQTYARAAQESGQIGLVAWYAYKLRDLNTALDWFKTAIQREADATVAHGLAHTLRLSGMLREAEEVAYAWREPFVNNMLLFIDLLSPELGRDLPPYVEPQRLARYAAVTMAAASGDGAQALGWYAYNSCQTDVALGWFERAVAWRPREAGVRGYALSLRRLKKDKPFFDVVNRYDGLFSGVVDLIFPDGAYHPPRPCDQRGADKLHGPAFSTTAYVVPGPALIPGAAPNYAQVAQTLAAPMEPAYVAGAPDAQLPIILKTIKGKFPAPTAPENPLRAQTLSDGLLPAAPPGLVAPSPPQGAFAADAARGLSPLVARRTPGVGPMPYERYGFSLLAGWNGVQTATWPPAAQTPPLPGTMLAEQDDAALRVGVAGYDARFDARSLAPGGAPAAPYAPPQVRQGYGPAPAPQLAPRPPAPAYGQYPQPYFRNP